MTTETLKKTAAEEELTRVQQQLAGANARNTELQAAVAAERERSGAFYADKVRLGGEVTALRGEVSALKTQVGALSKVAAVASVVGLGVLLFRGRR